ncbi:MULTISPECIES: GntR family transcriptional regulator [Cupriavidus]|uniref:GntR family transcriptional regulator n=1 Tax=Cupriavidus oxalaticus TaxID=96344 RepID=A0A4P7LBS2_9BURK|nr:MULTISPECIES: GntR family transcriptional regulator [Cupriavidus]MBF6987390.1 GntR family transcriptional regulator [Cupriavidus sp. IK-TO18]QBY53434.1 GntR family transcriptional regulator [Cupriavidus oxalaticus]
MSKTNPAEISKQLIEGITSGRYAVGSLLPTEFELCEQYQASRYTIRAVLQELQQLGLVSRRKNVGTRVESARPRPVFRPSLASVDDLMQFAAEHLRVVQSVDEVAVTAEVAAEIGCEPGARWLRISSLRMDGGEGGTPMAWTDIYVDPAYAELGELVRASPDMLVSTLMESRYDRQIAEIRQDVRAFALGEGRIAEALRLEPGAAALKIVRRYLDAAGETFEVSVTVHPADSFSVSMRLQRSAG